MRLKKSSDIRSPPLDAEGATILLMQKRRQNISSADNHKPSILGNVAISFIVTENLKFLVSKRFVTVGCDINVTDNTETAVF